MQKNFKEKLQDLNSSVEDLWSRAYRDSLTELPNRAALEDDLLTYVNNLQSDQTRTFAVLYMDLNGFKKVNDILGHESGDVLLQQVAKRLKEKHNDNAFRLGGDEFVVLLQCNDSDEAMSKAEQTRESLAEKYNLKDQDCYVGPSIGIVFSDVLTDLNKDGIEAARELLRLGDETMYIAKKTGKASLLIDAPPNAGNCLLYGPDMPVIFDYPDYQPIFRSGFGKGRLICEDGNVEGDFRFVQYNSGQILIFSRHYPTRDSAHNFLKEKWTFETQVFSVGNNENYITTTSHLQLVHLDSYSLENQLHKFVDDIVFHAPDARIDFKNGLTESIRFYIVNLIFPLRANVFDDRSINFKIERFEITLTSVEGAKELVRDLIATKAVATTWHAEIKNVSKSDTQVVTEIMDDVCNILTLLQRSRVGWIGYDILDKNASVLSSYARHTSVGELRNPNTAKELSSIIENDMPILFTGLKLAIDEWNFDVVLQFFANAEHTGDQCEGQAYKLIHCLDLLLHTYRNKFHSDISEMSSAQYEPLLMKMCRHLQIEGYGYKTAKENEQELIKAVHDVVVLKTALQKNGTLNLPKTVTSKKNKGFQFERFRRTDFLRDFLQQCLLAILNPEGEHIIMSLHMDGYEEELRKMEDKA